MTMQEMLKESGLTLYRLSKDTGISFSTISDIFSGKRSLENCSARTMQIMSVVFGYSIEELLKMKNMGKYAKKDVYSIQEICEICKSVFENEADIEKAYLFGSYARGEASAESDIDIVLEVSRYMGKRILYLNSVLEMNFGKRVDIYTADEISFLMGEIERDRRIIYNGRTEKRAA